MCLFVYVPPPDLFQVWGYAVLCVQLACLLLPNNNQKPSFLFLNLHVLYSVKMVSLQMFCHSGTAALSLSKQVRGIMYETARLNVHSGSSAGIDVGWSLNLACHKLRSLWRLDQDSTQDPIQGPSSSCVP